MKIGIASDHKGLNLKTRLRTFAANDLGLSVIDLGTDSDERVDYHMYACALANAIADGRVQMGVLVCGSGVGMQIAANRHPHVRATVLSEEYTARMSREHNDANTAVFGANLVPVEAAQNLLTIFLTTPFEGGRHAPRVKALGQLPMVEGP